MWSRVKLIIFSCVKARSSKLELLFCHAWFWVRLNILWQYLKEKSLETFLGFSSSKESCFVVFFLLTSIGFILVLQRFLNNGNKRFQVWNYLKSCKIHCFFSFRILSWKLLVNLKALSSFLLHSYFGTANLMQKVWKTFTPSMMI